MTHQVLVVEDDDGIALPLVRTLEREGHAVTRVAEGEAAVAHVEAVPVDLVVLDLGLPDVDGLDVCRRLRDGGYDGGILILTARGGELDRVVGLDVGADDYLSKPFALAELMARARALLRRATRPTTTSPPVVAAPLAAPVPTDAGPATAPPVAAQPATAAEAALRVDRAARRVWVGSREVLLSAKEFDLLDVLHAQAGAVLTRERLMSEVWDEHWFGSTKTLDVTLGRLRAKLDEHQAPVRVISVRGVGFRLELLDA